MEVLRLVFIFVIVLVSSEAKIQPESKLYFSIPIGVAPKPPAVKPVWPSIFPPIVFPGLPSIPRPQPSQPVDTSPAGQKAAQQAALQAHNAHRRKHHSPDLTLDEDLNAMALKCAQYYANQQRIDHTCPYRSSTVGENLAGGFGAWDTKSTTDMWYNEVNAYNYNSPMANFAGTGHFTQVVWKGGQKLGYAVATYNGYTAVVGIYDPGQYAGGHNDNVLRP